MKIFNLQATEGSDLWETDEARSTTATAYWLVNRKGEPTPWIQWMKLWTWRSKGSWHSQVKDWRGDAWTERGLQRPVESHSSIQLTAVCEETTGDLEIKYGCNGDTHHKSLKVPLISKLFSGYSNALLFWLESEMSDSSFVPSCHNYHRSGIPWGFSQCQLNWY